MKSNPFLTTYELSKLIKCELNTNASSTTCWRSIQKANFSRKRSRTQVRKEDTFKSAYNFISVDETFFYLYDCPKYGYSKKGVTLIIHQGKRK